MINFFPVIICNVVYYPCDFVELLNDRMLRPSNIGCLPPNKIPQTTIVAFGTIIDTWNVSVYIEIIDKNIYILQYLTFITTSPLKHVTNDIQYFCKMLYIKMDAPRPSTRQHAIWWTATYTTECNVLSLNGLFATIVDLVPLE